MSHSRFLFLPLMFVFKCYIDRYNRLFVIDNNKFVFRQQNLFETWDFFTVLQVMRDDSDAIRSVVLCTYSTRITSKDFEDCKYTLIEIDTSYQVSSRNKGFTIDLHRRSNLINTDANE
jgi:hypothetical protein